MNVVYRVSQVSEVLESPASLNQRTKYKMFPGVPQMMLEATGKNFFNFLRMRADLPLCPHIQDHLSNQAKCKINHNREH